MITIINTLTDDKQEADGTAGPTEEALAQNYNWGWCMVGQVRLLFDKY